MKTFLLVPLVALCFFLVSSDIAFSQRLVADIRGDYKANKALSDYLDTQGFKLGISRQEANKLYQIAYQRSGYPYAFSSQATDAGWERPVREGFYRFSFNKNGAATNNMYKISKVLGIAKDMNMTELENEFKKKYNLKALPTFLNHHGRFIIVNLIDVPTPGLKLSVPKALVLQVSDTTENLEELEVEQQKTKSGTDKLKGKF